MGDPDKTQESEETLRKTVEDDPTDAKAWNELGIALRKKWQARRSSEGVQKGN